MEDLKKKLQSRLDTPPKEQKLVFAGKEMKDDTILSDYPQFILFIVFMEEQQGKSLLMLSAAFHLV